MLQSSDAQSAVLKDLINFKDSKFFEVNMAEVVITMKIMPDSPDADLDKIERDVTKLITGFGGEVGKREIEPIAFGLKAIKLIFVANESGGGTDELEAKVADIEGVGGVEIVDVRRAIG